MTTVLLSGAVATDAHLARLLRNAGVNVSTKADAGSIDAVLYGARGTDYDALANLPAAPVIVLARNPAPGAVVAAMRAGAADYLTRPFDRDVLLQAIERLNGSPDEQAPPVPDAHGLLGECDAIQQLLDHVRRVGPTNSAVLIEGETGTGKALLARALHNASDRRHAPMQTMSCGAIPAEQQEQELFGAPGGDSRQPAGLVETAHQSTLFLDDVGTLSASVQARLLKVLETGEHQRLGGGERRPVDLRIIASCQHRLAAAVTDGRFREDLYYQLNVISLAPPPLRERQDDVLLLARHFLNRVTRKLGRDNAELTPEAIDAVRAYPWPGNVRELENAIERAVILSSDGTITAELLAIDPAQPQPADPANEAEPNVSLEDYFVKFVTENQDQFTETELAERLGISRKSLWERRQRLNIPRKRTRKRAPRRS